MLTLHRMYTLKNEFCKLLTKQNKTNKQTKPAESSLGRRETHYLRAATLYYLKSLVVKKKTISHKNNKWGNVGKETVSSN